MAFTAEAVTRFDDWLRFGMPFFGTADETHDLRIVDTLGVRGRPNGRYLRFHLDNYGFRGTANISVARRAGCERILILGASETFGATEPDGLEYPAQLARHLNERRCSEVLNAGVPGVGLQAIRYTWDHYWRRFAPDYVLIYPSPVFYLGNQPPKTVRIEELRTRIPPRVVFKPRLVLLAHEAISYPEMIQRHRVQRFIRDGLDGIPEDSIWRNVPEDRVRMFVADLDTLVSDIQQAGAKPVLLSHAMRFSTPPDPADSDMLAAWRQFTPRAMPNVLLAFEARAAEETRALAARRALPLADVACVLSGRRALFADFVHFTADGAAVVAKVAEDAMHPAAELAITQSGSERANFGYCASGSLTSRELR